MGNQNLFIRLPYFGLDRCVWAKSMALLVSHQTKTNIYEQFIYKTYNIDIIYHTDLLIQF